MKGMPILVLYLWLSLNPLFAQQHYSIADSFKTFLIEENLQQFLGLGIALIEKGEPDLLFTHGYQNHIDEVAFTDSTLFNLGPVSKLFTAIAIAKLVEGRAIQLEDPVYLYFPEFLQIQGKNKYARQITILDLLQHQSGITQSMEVLYPEKFDAGTAQTEEEFYENTYNYRAFLNTEEFKERFLMYARIDKKPHKQYHYSSLGYVILGYLIEEITGINLGEFVTNQIFVPLKMEDSHYYRTPDSLVERLAQGYYRLSDGAYLNVHRNEIESPSPTGDGGIKTSIRDMAKFMHFLAGDYQSPVYDSILSRSALLSMTAPMVKGPDKTTWMGIGFHCLEPYRFAGHAGSWDGFLNLLYYHPATHSCLFVTTNREDNSLFLFLRIYAAYTLLQGN